MDYTTTKNEDSWTKMMRKSLLAGVSEKNPYTLTSGPLGQSNVSGLSLLTKKVLDQQCSSILGVADEIWLAIIKIQDLMHTRNSINENCMQSEEEANRLLKSTNSVQQLIEHISSQEDTFITLSDSVNKNTIKIVQSYLRLMQKSIEITKIIAQETTEHLAIDIKAQNPGVEKELLNATSRDALMKFSIENTLETHVKRNPIELVEKYLDHEKYDDFIVMQAYLLICYRYAMSQAVSGTSDFDAYRVLQDCIGRKSMATELLHEADIEKTFNLEDFSKQNSISDQLQHALTVNPDYILKLEKTLNELKELSDSRKPDEEESKQAA